MRNDDGIGISHRVTRNKEVEHNYHWRVRGGGGESKSSAFCAHGFCIQNENVVRFKNSEKYETVDTWQPDSSSFWLANCSYQNIQHLY